jgi:hypothetical protein
MNFDWVKAPKNEEEEKEQFDKLYHMLVQLSAKKEPVPPQLDPSPPISHPTGDEFTRLKLDILANFRSGNGFGAIPALETCQGCNQSFYSGAERERHLQQTPACQEWIRRGVITRPGWDVPLFAFLEQGVGVLLTASKECRFCRKPMKGRKGLEKHFAQTPLCNRLAHDSFRTWFLASVAPSSPLSASKDGTASGSI